MTVVWNNSYTFTTYGWVTLSSVWHKHIVIVSYGHSDGDGGGNGDSDGDGDNVDEGGDGVISLYSYAFIRR